MTKTLILIAFVVCSFGFVTAQGNGNAAPPAWSNSISTEVHILQQAQPFFEVQLGVNLGQLIQAYRRGECTIEHMATNPPSETYRVRFGGHDILVIIDAA